MSEGKTANSLKRFAFTEKLGSGPVTQSELPKSVTEKLEFLKTHKEAIKNDSLNDFINKKSRLLETSKTSSPRLENLLSRKTNSSNGSRDNFIKSSSPKSFSSCNSSQVFEALPVYVKSSTNSQNVEQTSKRNSILDDFEAIFGDDSDFSTTQKPESPRQDKSIYEISSPEISPKISKLSFKKNGNVNSQEMSCSAGASKTTSSSSLPSTSSWNDTKVKPKKKFTFGRGVNTNVLNQRDAITSSPSTISNTSSTQPIPTTAAKIQSTSTFPSTSRIVPSLPELAKPALPELSLPEPYSNTNANNNHQNYSIENYDLTDIDWDDEVDWNTDANQMDTKILDSPPRSEMLPTRSGITMDDYVDDDFDFSILGAVEDDDIVKPTQTGPPKVKTIDFDATVCFNDSFNKRTDNFDAGPSTSLSSVAPNGEMRFIPIDKDAKTRKDDTAAFQKQYLFSDDLREILHEKFGLKQFRPNQEEIMNAALEKHDCFVLMPTGGGKSLCYQLPALLTPGVTIVISPLKALIMDQVNKLKSLDIPCAHMLGDLSKDDHTDVVRLLSKLEPVIKLLFLTPEKIAGSRTTFDLLTGLYARGKLARIVLDEAHCVSQWGHDFRPDYKQLSTLRVNFPKTPIMCLTATATNIVQQDVIKLLKLKNIKTFIRSFNRPNIKYAVLEKTKQIATENISILIKNNFRRMSGIIYSLARKDCDTLAGDLRKLGIKAQSYHAGLTDKQREKVQLEWMNNDNHIICATIAFGMGIDKPDVRFVIHNSMPKSVESFYQESGRGGRDGETSYSYLFYSYSDVVRLQRIIKMDKAISRNNLEAHFDQVNQMAQYCENRIDCRRYLQLFHLGEKFDRRLCIRDKATICDNCANFGKINIQDVVKESRELATMVKDLGSNRNYTMLHYVDVYKGAKLKKVIALKHNLHKYYGAGAHLDKSDIHRIMKELTFKKVFAENATYNGDFPVVYVKTGPNYNRIFDPNTALTIPFSKKSGKSQNKKVNDDFKEPLPIASVPAAVKTQPFATSRSTTPTKTKSPGKSIEHQVNNLRVKCHEELLEQCATFAGQQQSNLSSIMNLSAIKVMSEEMPTSAADFLSIQYVTKANFEKFGKEFLAITQKYRQEVDKLEAQRALDVFRMEMNDNDDWMGDIGVANTSSESSRGRTSYRGRCRGVKRKITSYRYVKNSFKRK